MLIVCAWCTEVIGHKEPFDDPSTSHGICLKCKRAVLDEELLRKLKQKRRDSS